MNGKWRPEFIDQAYEVCQLGATDRKLAKVFNVCVDTIKDWKKRHPEFKEALRASKKKADARVVKSLYERAMGYSHDETKVFCKDGAITTHTITKHYPPDTNAIIFWLKNRQPEDWRDKVYTDVSNPDGSLKNVSVTQVALKIQGILERAKGLKAKAEAEPEGDEVDGFV